MIELIAQPPYPPNAVKSKCNNWAYDLSEDEHWQIADEFIDAHSGLCVLVLAGLSRPLPTKIYLINPNPIELLQAEDWRPLFDYEAKEMQDPKGQFILKIQRIWSQDGDYYKEELFELPEKKLLTQRKRLAFEEKQAESLLLKQLRKVRLQKESLRKLNLDELWQKQQAKIAQTPELLLLSYVDEANAIFRLWAKKGELQLHDEEGQTIQEFENLTDFWWFWNAAGLFFLYYRPCHHCLDYIERPLPLSKWIVELGNQLRRSQSLHSSDYFLLQQWENLCYDPILSPNCFEQFCPTCGSEMPYNPRYPKRICEKCQTKAKNEFGQSLRFYNQGLTGGLLLETLSETGEVLNRDQGRSQYHCYINNQLCLLHEGRFGGLIVRLLD
ncbi:hypothetical protein PPO43_08680 [Saprospira sp. CCB-QB6]|uniref:hypothetical protein n=1 Tax=Saprospira sp. CCB-QB6 TaxID=3023936 RepID=UPI00234B5984|nr:hypothetical protein [Saprospira sp. CCB-QB6]WCL80054.1 hypothetical protein PPO43_08680 [Saprospira sp. CCB-QB6]